MKYRIKQIDEKEFDVITEDGGIASIYCNEDGYNTMYYQSRITDAYCMDDVDDVLADSKAYFKEWGENADKDEMIKDALSWLVVGENTWERDDTILELYID